MRSLMKRVGTPVAVLMLAAGTAYGLRVEKSLNVGKYYRELAPEHMGRVERVVFSIVLAAGDRLQKHKGQAHASLPFYTNPTAV